ncbi:snaclec A13-like [Paralichthys olivaceus]|uniref:snaclec A13-like n=1 Tax=Paralichthys olivaceus TaxID=8255 RepID=UPI0037503AE2
MRPAPVTAVLLLVALSFMRNSAAGIIRRNIPKYCESIMSPESCDPGWYRLDASHCMKEAPIKATFDDAESFCQSEGGHLVKIGIFWSHYRAMCMMIFEKSETASYWVGARRQQDGTYEWTDGSGPVALRNPSDNNDCVELFWGHWNFVPCSSTRNFVCQKVM